MAPAKLERCVKEVSAKLKAEGKKGAKSSAWAICTAAQNKKKGKKSK